jgi:gliding motility-associated-like protein
VYHKTIKSALRVLFVVLMFFPLQKSLAQAPAITYASPKTYIVGSSIIPLLPVNTGGAVPANSYNMVSRFAGGYAPVSFDGVGADAGFDNPSGIGTDALGNVYVSDFGSGAIRKITPAAIVTTIGNINTPSGLTVDNLGNIFVSSFDESRIYKISPAGVKTVFAGNGGSGSVDGMGTAASFYGPGGMTTDVAGNLYVADQSNNKIRKVTPAGLVTTIAGSGSAAANDGPAVSASFYNPDGVAVDALGNIYVADSKNNKIRKISVGGLVSTFAGSGAAGYLNGIGATASFNYPTSLDADVAGNLYVSDYRNNVIRKISPTGVVTTLAGSGSTGNLNGIGTAASFYGPLGLVFDQNDNLYVADYINDLIRKITLTGYVIDKVLPPGLNFDPSTGIISGTPTGPAVATDYKITAYNIYGNSSADVNIEVLRPSPVSLAPFPVKTVCSDDFDPGAVSNVPVTYTSSNPLVAIVVNGKIHIVGPGVSTITVSNGASFADQILTVDSLLIPSVKITPTYFSSCEGMELTYEAITIDAGINPTYQWQVNGQNVGVNSSKFISSDLKTGDIITCVVTNNDACISVSSPVSGPASLDTTPYTSIAVSIVSSVSGSMCPGTPVTFTAIPSDNVHSPNYSWYVNGVLTATNSSVFAVATLKNGAVVYCVMVAGGACILNPVVNSNSISVSILNGADCVIKVPNAFSPNGDNINDKWIINALNASEGCTVKVFNRQGSIVYQSIGYGDPWDGTTNGKAVPIGTYYYLIALENGKKKMSGSITILR